MKKSVPGSMARLTAGCLPVPLFNQKKRARQPFTSSPGAASETQDFPPLPTDFVWEMMKPEVPPPKKMMKAGQPSPTQESGFNRDQLDMARGHNWSSWSHREESTKAWDRNEFAPPRKSSCSVASSGPGAGLATLETNQRRWGHPQAAGARGLGSGGSSSHVARCNSQPGQLKRRSFGNTPEEKGIKEVPGCQLMLKEDDTSLRILPAVIESMKLWKERLPHWPLLFEVLGTLDSAVTSGAHGAKTFLLRDGKSTVPCAFYEIDRELPRLIRGHIHRCVGSYDPKRGLLQCVSVRPASASEQRTFQEFVRTADAKLSYYASAMSEM
ncbi:spermatogenesis-associated protein 22 isoform X2 [Vombatus ursinus]|uniref:Spermatogenesis associated 22 n=1 Tax=Vombatus ursinus TaxID=29139 RepID=A0A4X2M2Z2_VOMUR|nr:spermatogenesis-associated protein 22 isoform X2 [Vombatus ursinus]